MNKKQEQDVEDVMVQIDDITNPKKATQAEAKEILEELECRVQSNLSCLNEEMAAAEEE